jgi:hypothetical protein
MIEGTEEKTRIKFSIIKQKEFLIVLVTNCTIGFLFAFFVAIVVALS